MHGTKQQVNHAPICPRCQRIAIGQHLSPVDRLYRVSSPRRICMRYFCDELDELAEMAREQLTARQCVGTEGRV